MNKAIAMILIAGSIGTFGCLQDKLAEPSGKYTSQDDFGVVIFKGNGTFYYKFATKFDFYDSAHLPPYKGTFKISDTGEIEILTIEKEQKNFKIEWHPEDDSFDLIRTDPNGTLPIKAKYKKIG